MCPPLRMFGPSTGADPKLHLAEKDPEFMPGSSIAHTHSPLANAFSLVCRLLCGFRETTCTSERPGTAHVLVTLVIYTRLSKRSDSNDGLGKGNSVPNQSHRELLARIGREYYLENRPKVDIAASYDISRFQVARLLTEARESGIVEIKVHFPAQLSGADVRRIEAALNVSRVIVADTTAEEIQAREILAKAAATEISRQAPARGTLGISWSRTLDAASRHITELPRCDIVQLAGALPAEADSNPMELIQRLGHLSGGLAWPLWSPLVVENPATASGLLRQPEIARALAKADSLDLAVVAIGAWKPGCSTVWERAEPEVRQDAVLAGAVAECSGRLLNSAGVPVESGLDERIIAVTIKQLQRTPRVIAVAQGEARAEAVRAVARAGFVTTLIVDEPLAKALNDLSDEEKNQ